MEVGHGEPLVKGAEVHYLNVFQTQKQALSEVRSNFDLQSLCLNNYFALLGKFSYLVWGPWLAHSIKVAVVNNNK